MMDLRAAAVPFMDEDGLMIERPNRSDGPETGNGIRERCVLEMLCFKRDETTAAHLQDFYRVIRSCEVKRGLYNRGPRKPGEMAAHDDRRCLSAVSSVLSLPFAKEIHDYGKSKCWVFNNLNPYARFLSWEGLSNCDRRFPGVVPAYRLQAGRNYLPLEDVELAGAILASAWSKSPKQKIIWWLSIEALTGRGLFDSQIDQWWKCLQVQYGPNRPMGAVFAAYYKDCPEHPYIELSPV